MYQIEWKGFRLMSKIVFLDVDGTLIDYEAKMPDSAKLAVDQARANGHKVYICTGCSKAEILQRNLCELDVIKLKKHK